MQNKWDASIAAHADQETLYDQPQVAKNKLRITGRSRWKPCRSRA